MKFKPFTGSEYTEAFWIKQLQYSGWEIVTGKYWDGEKWIIFKSDYAGKGKGDVSSLLTVPGLDFTVRDIIFSDLNLENESLVADADILYIVRGDFNSLDLIEPKEIDLTTITFKLSPEYWMIYNYSASDFELVGATGTTITATAIAYDVSNKTFTLTFPDFKHINPAPDLPTRLFMRSGNITNVFGTVLDEAYLTFETTYVAVPPDPGTYNYTESMHVNADINYLVRDVTFSDESLDDESITANADLHAVVKDINDTIIIQF